MFVKFSGFNGIVYHGEVLAEVSWDEPKDSYVLRYWYDPEGEPPRKPYTIVRRTEVEIIGDRPSGFVMAS